MFDKQKFADILIGIKAKRSINQYGKDTGVDAGYLSRLISKKRDSAPSPDIIYKLTQDSNVALQLMSAAGHIPSFQSDPEEWLNEIKAASPEKKEAIQLIWNIIKTF